MLKPTHPAHARQLHQKNFGALYIAITLLSLHWALVIYINSSFLKQFIEDSSLGLLYTTSSALTILSFLFISRVLHKLGNFKLTLFLALTEMAALTGMAFADTLRVAIPLFLIHQWAVPLILFNLDVFMERLVGDEESQTGSKRGLYLSIASLAGAIAPLATGYLVNGGNGSFTFAYLASAILLIPFFFVIIKYFRKFEDPRYTELDVLKTIHSFWINHDIRNVFLAAFSLQFFYVWMVVYVPLYLSTYMHFSWSEIGLIIAVAIMAFVLFEYPVGIICDLFFGEKEIMIIGFAVIAIATASFAFLPAGAMGVWMLAMFMTRTGASFVETTTESYFFKHTRGKDAHFISFFRLTRPLAYVLGALVGSLALLYIPFNTVFIILALCMLPGILFAALLHDTK